MADPFIGEIRIFSGKFAPKNWAFCDGQLLAIAQNTALFSLLGTMYGGDGRVTFALPDLRGAVPLGFGQGPGLSNYFQGQVGGQASITLIASQMPVHSHLLEAATTAGIPSPDGQVLGQPRATNPVYTDSTPTTLLNSEALKLQGGGQPIPNLQPYLTLNFIIALQGIFPPRN